MGLREKVALVLTVVLTVQISTSFCVTSAYKPDALQRYLDKEKLKTTKSPYVTGSSVKFNKNAALKKSLIKAFNFPEIEYPSDTSTRDYYTLGNNFNRNSYGPVPKKTPTSQSKAVEDFKKDLRMKRKLDKISEHYHTPDAASTFITSLSGPESVILTDTEVFPEVQYPLNALETWAPHYWNPPTISQKELDYKRPESLIFNPKGSDKSNKPYAPYKKQVKSKVKLFMEDIDKLNEKRYNQKTQYKETRDSNNKKESPAIFINDFNTPDSNNSKISLLDPECLSNKTTEVSSSYIHNDSANFNISENQDLKDLLIEIHERNNTSPQTGTSQLNSDVPDSTSIPYKIQEESNFPSQSEYKNVENEDSHALKEEKDYLIPKVEEEVVEEVELQIPLSMVIPNDSFDLQATTITTGNTDTVETTAIESLNQTYKDTAIISNDGPLNVNIPLPELDTYDQIVTDFSNKTTPLSDINKNPRPSIIVVPVDDYVNMMQIPNFNRLADASIIVLTPTKKDVTAITASNTFDTLPITNERNPLANTRSTTSDFEMLPNNSMCHVLSNAVTCTNGTTQHYTVNEFTDALSTSEDNDIIQNTTTILCDTNNSSEIHSEVILPCTLLHNTPIPLPNDFPNRMPSNIVPDPTLLHRIEDTVTNSKSTEMPIDKVTNQEMNHYTSFELAGNSLPSSANRVDFSLFNFDDVKQFSEINKLSDIQKANPIRSVNKTFQQKSVTERNVLPDSQLFEQASNTDHQDATLPHTTEQIEHLINNERSERNQDTVISKDVQIPTQDFSNYSHNNLNSGNFYGYRSNTNISNVEEENSGMPENNQILSIPLTNDAKTEETLLESTITEQKMVTDELITNNDKVNQTKDIQDASESMTPPHEPHLVTTLAAPTPGQEDFYSIEHAKLKDMTYPTDNSTSIMENTLQANEIHDTTMDISVSREKQFQDNFNQTVPISIKNRLPLRHVSDYEKRLPLESSIDYSPSLPSFTDNPTLSNTDLDNDEQPLLNDFEQEKNIHLIPNDTLRDAVNIDYMTSFENNSNTEKYQNTIQSEISSAESLLLNTDKKIIVHSKENMSLLFTPVQEDSYSIVHLNLEDMTYLNGPTDKSTSIMENELQDSEIHDTTMDIPVSYEKQFTDNITVPSSIKNRLPLRQDSDYEKRLPSESNIDYSPSLPSFSDNSTISNTDLDNDEQPLLNDLEQEQNIYLISNETLRDAVNIDYLASFENNSNAEKYLNTIQSEISSAESLLLNTDMRNIEHSEENMSLLFTPVQENSYSIVHVNLENMTYLNGPTDNSTSIMENAPQDSEIHGTTIDIPVSYEKQFIDNITVPISIKNRLPLRQDSGYEKRLLSESNMDYSPSLHSFSDNSTISNIDLDNDEQPLLNDLEREQNIYLISNDRFSDAVYKDNITSIENNSNAEEYQNNVQSEISSAESLLLNTDMKNIVHSEEKMSILFTPVQENSYSIVHVNLEDMTYLNGPTDNSTSNMENALQDSEIHGTTMDIPVSYEKQFIDNVTVPISIKNRLPLRQDAGYEKRLLSESNIAYSPSLPSFSDNSTISNIDLDNDEQPLLNDLEREQNIYLISNDRFSDAVYKDNIISIENNSNAEEYQNNVQSEISSAESLLLNTDMKNFVHSEEKMSLLPIDTYQNEVIENKSIVDSPSQDGVNESYKSLNEVLTETILNDISDDDMRDNKSTTLLDGSEEAIQETYKTQTFSDLILKSESDNFIGRDTQLLAKSNLTDPPRSDSKNVKIFPATLFIDTVSFNPLEVNEPESDKSLTDDDIETETINEPFDVSSINIDSEYPLLVDEFLVDKYYDDEEPLQTDITF